MNRYQDIGRESVHQRREKQRLAQQVILYQRIFKSASVIVNTLLPSDKAAIITANVKSIMYSLIELKTGKPPSKF